MPAPNNGGPIQPESVTLGYGMVPEFYAVSQRRMDVIEGRLGALSTVVASVSAAVPTLLRMQANALDFTDARFVSAMASAAAIVVLALWQRHRGTMLVLDPKAIQANYVKLPAGEFRQQVLYWSGEHFAKNMARVQRKALWLDWLTAAFFVELALVIWWICVP